MASKLHRALKYAGFLLHPLAARLHRRAFLLRQEGQYQAAAILYEEASRSSPRQAWINVQAGHMFKEAGDHANAERHYLKALERMPQDEDLALQLGHFYKVAGRLAEAEASYARALALRPGWEDAAFELAELRLRIGGAWSADDAAEGQPLLPEVMPRADRAPSLPRVDVVQVRHLGRPERGPQGVTRTLRGVEALRGFCISATPIEAVELALDGEVVAREGVKGGYPVPSGPGRAGLSKYVFNLWHDFTAVAEGPHRVELRCLDARGRARIHRAPVRIAPPRVEAREEASDGFVAVDPGDPRPIEEQINARPSMVRPAARALLTELPRTVLVQRVDQLGDLAVSVPAIRRLRAILPQARLIGLLSPANAGLARTLDLFDDIVLADFPEDAGERRRVMTAPAQEALRATLSPYRIDLAIDLSASAASRPLLLLSGARALYGFGGRDNPWLTAGVDGFSHDARNGHESAPHGARLVGLVEWLGAILTGHARPEPNPALRREMLARYGIAADERYVVLHAGARLAFSRWHGFAALAAMILERTDLTVVMMGEEAELPPALAGSDRLRIVGGQIPFEHFDALLSFCAVMVGNDSGPKHLAALRGVKVVSIHMARINWSEWGQEGDGLVISRRVPCAGCGIHYEPQECGKDFACIANISAGEVFAAVARLL